MTDSYIEFEIKERLNEITTQLAHIILEIITVSLQNIDDAQCLKHLKEPKPKPAQTNEIPF